MKVSRFSSPKHNDLKKEFDELYRDWNDRKVESALKKKNKILLIDLEDYIQRAETLRDKIISDRRYTTLLGKINSLLIQLRTYWNIQKGSGYKRNNKKRRTSKRKTRSKRKKRRTRSKLSKRSKRKKRYRRSRRTRKSRRSRKK